MKGKQIEQVLMVILSSVVKVAIALWLISFIYDKAQEAYDFGFRVFTEEPVSPAPGRDITVAITEGKTEREIATILTNKGLTRNEWLTYAQIFASEYRETIEPGVYTLNTSMTTEEMMAAMSPSIEKETEDEE